MPGISFAGYSPEVGSVIGDKCQFMFAARCVGAATTTTWFPIAREKEKGANKCAKNCWNYTKTF
jgi:hypothetical protein